MFGWIPRLLAWFARWQSARRMQRLAASERNPASLLMMEQQMQQWR